MHPMWVRRFSLRVRITTRAKWLSMKQIMLRAKWAIATHQKLIALKDFPRKAKRRLLRAKRNVRLPSALGISTPRPTESPIPHLVQSNLPPTDSEAVLVRRLIQQASEERARLRSKLLLRKMAGVDENAWEAVTRHKVGRASRFIRQHQRIFSPVRLLPPELLAEIFAWISITLPHYPWYLGQVCRSWRHSALAVSSLWRSLPTLSLKKGKHGTMRQVAAITEMLERLRGAPVNFHLIAESAVLLYHPVLPLLVQHCERWHTITLKVQQDLMSMFKPIQGRLPTLRSLTLQVSYWKPESPLDMFEVAPNLKEVHISHMHSGLLRLPYRQLVSYKECLTSRALVAIAVPAPLSALENLTVLELSDGPVFPPTTLPHLVKLTVKLKYPLGIPLLQNLTLPNLEELEVVSGMGILERLIRMLSNTTSRKLRNLKYRTDPQASGLFVQLLQLTPNLVSLDATTPCSHVDIEALMVGGANGQRPLVPCLESCKFQVYDETPYANGIGFCSEVIALASSRCEVPSSSAGSFIPGESIKRLKTLCFYDDNSERGHALQASLHDWKTTLALAKLKEMKSQLLQELPELGGERKTGIEGPMVLDDRWEDGVRGVLDRIDEFEVDDVDDIYHSDIHTTLRNLRDPTFLIKGIQRTGISERAGEILQKWEVLFREKLHERKWVFQGGNCLVYVPQDDPIRTSPDALQLIYGYSDPARYIMDLSRAKGN